MDWTERTLSVQHIGSPRLAQFVEHIRVKSAAVPGATSHGVRLPDGRTLLLLRVTGGLQSDHTGPSSGDLSVIGTRTRALYKTVSSIPLAVAVRFRPGAASRLLGVPARAVTDRIVRLEDLWGREGRVLRDQLLSARNASEILRSLVGALEERAKAIREGCSELMARRAIQVIRGSRTEINITHLSATFGVTVRHFRRAFAETVGVGPKQFARIVRFQRAARIAQSGASWTEVAHQAGYYDQAHMIREFRALTGTTPGKFSKHPSAIHW